MRELKMTDYSNKETDTSTMTLTLFDDGLPTELVGDLSVIVANDDGDVKQLKYELADNRIIITPAAELPAGRYRLEVWLVNGVAHSIKLRQAKNGIEQITLPVTFTHKYKIAAGWLAWCMRRRWFSHRL